MPTKTKGKLGGVFADTPDMTAERAASPAAPLAPPEDGKKGKTKEGYRQTSMILKNAHISWLEKLVADASERGIVTTKTEVIEILIELAKDAGVSFAEMEPSQDKVSQIQERFIEKLSRL